MPDNPSHLDYAQPTSAAWQRKHGRRALIVGAIVLGILVSIPFLRHQLETMHRTSLFDACAAMKMPPIIRTDSAGGQSTISVPAAWRELNDAMKSNINSYGTLFVGTLTPSGSTHAFVVGVDLVGTSRAPTIIRTCTRAISRGTEQGTWRSDWPAGWSGRMSDQAVILEGTASKLVIHGGVVDPMDPSHFTVAYDADQQSGIIDGWFKSDLSVTLELRVGATTAPAPPLPGKSP